MKPTTSLTLLRIHKTIEPIIPGKAAPAFSVNLANKFFNASNLFLIHGRVGVGLGIGVTLFGVSNSTRKPIVIRIAVNNVVMVTVHKKVFLFPPQVFYPLIFYVSFI